MHLSDLLKFYKREDIQKAIVESVPHKEVAMKFGSRGFGKRPDVLKYPGDIIELAKQGCTSFHCSEELWTNPLMIGTDLSKGDVDQLRKGWDLILDIDCKELEYSKYAADLIIRALRYEGVSSIYCKFSGNHGFHIGVPFEAFPSMINGVETRLLFPEGPKRIALYLRERTRELLSKTLLERFPLDIMLEKTGKTRQEVIKDDVFDPFELVDIDTLLISQRHLYRSVYSFNEKSGLVSIPVDPDKVLDFDKSTAQYQNVTVSAVPFLSRGNILPNEAKKLIVQAFDFNPKQEEDVIEKEEYEIPGEAIPEQFFPPYIKDMFKGMKDGRKRALFVLVNFLTNVGWSYEQIEERIDLWNKSNPEPLKEVLIKGHLRYHKQQKRKLMPPNVDNRAYYPDMQKYASDPWCLKIKNPVNYAKMRARMASEEQKYKKPEDNPELSEAQKEFIKKRKEEERAFKQKMKKEHAGATPP